MILFSLTFLSLKSQTSIPYRMMLERADGNHIYFNMNLSQDKGKMKWVIKNADEKLVVDQITKVNDSLLAEMPFFDSRIMVQIGKDKVIRGSWYKGTSSGTYNRMSVTGKPNVTMRFPLIKGNAFKNISGRYAAVFYETNGEQEQTVLELHQKDNSVKGTFLTSTGDYRFLEGVVTGDSLMMSTFDGSHAYFFSAKMNGDKLINGIFYSGASFRQKWDAVKDAKASIDESSALARVKEGAERLNFRFPDLDSNMVSINDEKFKNKVVVIQIMGSWCPNCMDETAFLSEYHKKNKAKGFEVIGLAYEYSTDFRKAEKTLRKFQQRYDVQYPILNTGVATTDKEFTEKTLPQLTTIKSFPTTIFIGKDGKIKKIHAGFSGPGTGQHYEEYKKEFDQYVHQLMAE